MRRIAVVLSAFLIFGCGSDSSTAPAPVVNGTIIFKIDAASCKGTSAVDLFIDGSLAGTETLSAGGTSKSYTVVSGQHVLAANISNTRAIVWPATTVTVPPNNSYTHILTC